MIQLNTEYTYSQICEELEWNIYNGGNSKKAQINEIEKCFEFYHPINTKTKKEKKSYIFTKQLKDPVKPTMDNSAGNNKKNILPMMKYIKHQALLMCDAKDYKFYSRTNWYCNILNLLDKEMCNVVYRGKEEIEKYIEDKEINAYNYRVLYDYVSDVKSVLKEMLETSLNSMAQKKMINCEFGHIFIYRMDEKNTDRIGKIGLSDLNVHFLLEKNETNICNTMKDEFFLSDKLKNRQLLMQIFNRKDLKECFDNRKIKTLMEDNNFLKTINYAICNEHPECPYMITEDTPIMNYFDGYRICEDITATKEDVELMNDVEKLDRLKEEIINIIRTKARKKFFNRKFYSNNENKMIPAYRKETHERDIDRIERFLFKTKITNNSIQEDDELNVWKNNSDNIIPFNKNNISNVISFSNSVWGSPNRMDATW